MRNAALLLALAVLLAAVALFVGQALLPTRGRPQAPEAFVDDGADLVPAASEARMNRLAAALLADADVEMVTVTVPSLGGRTIADFAGEAFEERRVGGRSRGDRGLLLVVAAAEQQVRLAVGYGLEALYPDAFVGYVERAQMVPYFRQQMLGEGIEATFELIARRAFGEIVEAGPEAESIAGPAATGGLPGPLAGGAGAETAVPLASAPEPEAPPPAPTLRGALADRFAAQPTPAAAWDRFLEIQRRRIKEVDLGIYDAVARDLLRRRPNTDGGQDHLARLYDGRRYEVRARGDRAVVVFPDDPDHLLAPWFFHRGDAGWQLDGAAPPELIGYNHLNQWRFKQRDHPYVFAFADYSFDRHGFATRRPAAER